VLKFTRDIDEICLLALVMQPIFAEYELRT